MFWASFLAKEGIDSPEPTRGISVKKRELYEKGVAKFFNRPFSIDLEVFEAARRFVQDMLRSEVGSCSPLSMEEAIERILLHAGSSASGPRWNKWGQTKREVLTNAEALEELRKMLEPQQLLVDSYFTLSLKDELRDIVEGKAKDARVFLPVSLPLLVATVMVYGRWNDRFVDSEFWGSMGQGFLRGGTDRLVTRLEKHPLCGEGDAQKFDTSQNPFMREVVYGLRNEFVWHELRAVVTFLMIWPRVMLPDGHLWELPGGNPSGSFNTLVDNSILTLLVLVYAFIRCLGRLPNPREIEAIVTGDDYLYSTVLEAFTPEVVRKYGSELGLTYDTGSLKSLSDSTFCQKRFEKSGDTWVGVPDAQRFWATMELNRCESAYDSAVLSQSVMIEHFYNQSLRRLLRRFQEFLEDEYLVVLEYLTDQQIDLLHKVGVSYENCSHECDP